MRVLVTGGAGFIGSNLVEDLLKQGHYVVSVDSLVTGSQYNIQKITKHPKFRFVQMNIENPSFLKRFTIRGSHFDEIYHLACPTGVPNIQKKGEEMLLACSFGTWNVLNVAKKYNSRVVFTSSSEIYGDPEVFPQKEDYSGNVDPVGVRANYEEGKRFSETLVKWFFTKYKLPVKIVRLFNTYGPAMSLTDERVVPQFAKQALLNIPLTLHGRGLQKRTFTYVSDMVVALRLVMKKGKPGEVYNIGSNREFTMVDLAKRIIRAANSMAHIKYVKRPAHDHSSRKPFLHKIYNLGWKPKINFEQGLKMTLADFASRLKVN
jgi:nucleoside-diphosphate-sugar epimerase